jgi:hypothetical protein
MVCFKVLLVTCLIVVSTTTTTNRQKRQLQTLVETIKANPALLSRLQSNPEVLRLLQSQLNKQQQQQQQQPTTPRRQSFLEPQQPSFDVQQCSALKKQNQLLRQMILSVTGGEDITDLDFMLNRDQRRLLGQQQKPQNHRQNNHQNQGLLQHFVDAQPIISLKSVLVTPSATWTTSMTTTSYVTTVTHTETSSLPIIIRGKKVTSILHYYTRLKSATRIRPTGKN